MVIRFLKSLLLILALVALPLRGMAAVAMWHCMPDHDEALSVPANLQVGHHGMHDKPAAGHSGHAASACSACAACCVGGAVAPAAWPSFSFAPAGAVRIPFAEQRFTGFVPAQLERPPLPQSL